MIDSAHSRAPTRELLWLVEQPGTQVYWRFILLGLVVDLHEMPIGIAKLISRAVSRIAIDPPLARIGLSQDPGQPLKCLWTHHSPGDMAQTCLLRLGEFERVTLIVAPGAQIDRLPLPFCYLHAEDVLKEMQTLGGFWRKNLNMAQMRDLLNRFLHSVHCKSSSCEAQNSSFILDFR